MIKVNTEEFLNALEDIFTEDGRFNYQHLSTSPLLNEELEWFDLLRAEATENLNGGDDIYITIPPEVREKINELKNYSLYELHNLGYRFSVVETTSDSLRVKVSPDVENGTIKVNGYIKHKALIGVGNISEAIELNTPNDVGYVDIILIVVNQIGDYISVSVGGGIITVGILPTYRKNKKLFEEIEEITTISLPYTLAVKIYNFVVGTIENAIYRYGMKN